MLVFCSMSLHGVHDDGPWRNHRQETGTDGGGSEAAARTTDRGRDGDRADAQERTGFAYERQGHADPRASGAASLVLGSRVLLSPSAQHQHVLQAESTRARTARNSGWLAPV